MLTYKYVSVHRQNTQDWCTLKNNNSTHVLNILVSTWYIYKYPQSINVFNHTQTKRLSTDQYVSKLILYVSIDQSHDHMMS